MRNLFSWLVTDPEVFPDNPRPVVSIWIVRRPPLDDAWRESNNYELIRPFRTGLDRESDAFGLWLSWAFLCCAWWNRCEDAAEKLGLPLDSTPDELIHTARYRGEIGLWLGLLAGTDEAGARFLPEPLCRPYPPAPKSAVWGDLSPIVPE